MTPIPKMCLLLLLYLQLFQILHLILPRKTKKNFRISKFILLRKLIKVLLLTLRILTPLPMLTSIYGNILGPAFWNLYSGFMCRWYSNASHGIFLSKKLQPFIRQSISSSLSTLKFYLLSVNIIIWRKIVYIK